MKKLLLIFIFIPNLLFAGSMKAIGTKGNEENVDRVIKVLMYDNYYKPDNFKVKKAPHTGSGIIINSKFLNGLTAPEESIAKTIKYLEEKN